MWVGVVQVRVSSDGLLGCRAKNNMNSFVCISGCQCFFLNLNLKASASVKGLGKIYISEFAFDVTQSFKGTST
jgi:hypothetical protein